jgi:exodeoxyribonuclease VII small subunit
MSKKLSFEEQLHQLEEIVGQLETGSLSLDQSMTAFESGIKLAKKCQKILDDAEQKIQYLTTDNLL